MKREEAVALLHEICSNCRELAPNYISLVKSHTEDQFSSGFQIHIQAQVDQETEKQIYALSTQYRLAIHRQQGKSIIIYKPKAQQ